MNKYKILIQAEFDGERRTQISEISDQDLNTLRPLFAAISGFTPYGEKGEYYNNYPTGEGRAVGEKTPLEIYGFEDATILLQRFAPYFEMGFQKIIKVEITPNSSTEILVGFA